MAVLMGCGQYSWQHTQGVVSTHDSTHGVWSVLTECRQYSQSVVSTHRVWSVLTGCGQYSDCVVSTHGAWLALTGYVLMAVLTGQYS